MAYESQVSENRLRQSRILCHGNLTPFNVSLRKKAERPPPPSVTNDWNVPTKDELYTDTFGQSLPVHRVQGSTAMKIRDEGCRIHARSDVRTTNRRRSTRSM